MDQDTLQMILREAVRETVTQVLQALLNADREAFLREHGGRKNGYYPRKLETAFGQVKLAIPRDREGKYYPSLLQPYARRQVDVGEVAIALYAAGVSQRKAAEVIPFLVVFFVHDRGRPPDPERAVAEGQEGQGPDREAPLSGRLP
ncbi:transposase, partial [Thermus scotoductus]|uniref:transposase n=1 Tax=Thermus scotoductus TaxID=37636 RepID=UPI0020A54363